MVREGELKELRREHGDDLRLIKSSEKDYDCDLKGGRYQKS